MLNVTIQNDGKIKIQSECSNTKEMRHFVKLPKVKQNEYKIIREAGQTQSQPTDSDSNSDNIITINIEVSCTAKSCNRHNGL